MPQALMLSANEHKLYFYTHYISDKYRNGVVIDQKTSALRTVLSAYIRIW